jgi:hypothetical protein
MEFSIAEPLLLIDDYDFRLTSKPREVTLIEERTNKRKKVIRLKGQFQKADWKNHNGRIYPFNVLKESIAEIQDRIRARRVLGELDHPCLNTDDFRVLTKNGWKEFKDIKIGDEVWSRKDAKAILSVVGSIIDEPYNGITYHVKGRHIDAEFTAPHKFLFEGNPEIYTTLDEIYKNQTKYDHYIIPFLKDEQRIYDIPLKENSTGFQIDNLKINKKHHEGNIYCLKVTHGNFYMEHKGYSFWTGNCDAKIHLDRVSHLITKVWMKGKTVYGELEIMESTELGRTLLGLIEGNASVGISSRGVGDVKSVIIDGEEYFEVLPGYQLITWDVVAEPSVQDSYLVLAESQNKSRLNNIFKVKNQKELEIIKLIQKELNSSKII